MPKTALMAETVAHRQSQKEWAKRLLLSPLGREQPGVLDSFRPGADSGNFAHQQTFVVYILANHIRGFFTWRKNAT